MGSLVQIQSPRPFFSPMPALLLTNDDGVHASGLGALAQALAELGEVYVLAPEREQSACGHALTLHRPLRVDRLGERRFGGNGTPPHRGNPRVAGFPPQPPPLLPARGHPRPDPRGGAAHFGTAAAAVGGTAPG